MVERVLVTGVAGFVGRHLADAVIGRGARVWGVGFGELPAGLRLERWTSADVTDAAAVAAAVAEAEPQWVIHLAGQSSAALSFRQPVETYRANVLGTWGLLDAVRRHAREARVLLVGSGEAYGPQAAGSRASESAPFRPVSPYALSKAAADSVGEAFANRHGLDLVRTRSFSHTGPGQSPAFALPSFARQIAAIEERPGEPVLRVGNLDVVRDITNVRDVTGAYLALLERGRRGAAYNVCSGEGTLLADAVRTLCGLARVPVRIEVDPALVRAADVPWLVGDPSAIGRDTGWHASTPLHQTLEGLLEDWRSRTTV